MKFSILLKQHTPILHFQWPQKGATLRASDLKPRLDRYIRKMFYNGDRSVKLRYKLKISYSGAEIFKGSDKHRDHDCMYFGNMGDTPEYKKKFHIHVPELELEFNTYFNPNLKTQIEKALPVCLALENFGTRSNKGNGCFFIKGKSRDNFEEILKSNHIGKIFCFDIDKSDYFFAIKTLYTLMKSGINLDVRGKKLRFKSAIFKYFKSRNVTWDKKAVKQHFLPHAKSNSWVSSNSRSEYARVVLGGSDIQDWRFYNRRLHINSANFDRIPSPIVFKVFVQNNKARVYFFARDSYKDVNGSFEFFMNGYKYCEAEFNSKSDISSLCNAINSRLRNIYIHNTFGTVDWLNKLLERSDLFNKLNNISMQGIDSELINTAKGLYGKRFRDLNSQARNSIIKFNRLLIEKNFANSPKIINTPLTLEAPTNFDMNGFLDHAGTYISGLKVSGGRGGRGFVERTNNILSIITNNNLKQLH